MSHHASTTAGLSQARPFTKFIIVVWLCSSFAGYPITEAHTKESASRFESAQLQNAFSQARDLKLVNRVSDIPADGMRLLSSLSLGMDSEVTPLADLGMEWSSSDALIPGLPRAQHRFSAANDKILLIIYVLGGQEVRYNALLSFRHSQQYCLFDLGHIDERNLSVAHIQWALNPHKDPAGAKVPECIPRESSR